MPAGQFTSSVIERAYELARSGRCLNVAEVSSRLKQERYESVEAHLAGPSIRRELRRICSEAAKTARPQPCEPEPSQSA